MKKIFVTTVLVILCLGVHSQNEIVESAWLLKHSELGGEGKLVKSIISSKNDLATKTFEIDVPETGNYTLTGWAMSAKVDNKFIEYDAIIDGNKVAAGKLIFTTDGWQSVILKDKNGKANKKIKLEAGHHNITFSCPAPQIPALDFVRINRNEAKATIADDNYMAYTAAIQNSSNQRRGIATINTVPDTTAGLLLKSAPAYDYLYRTDVPYNYTFYTLNSFNANTIVNISSAKSPLITSNFSYVIEVFSLSYPEKYSWSNYFLNNGSYSFRIPTTDIYCVRLRSYIQNSSGLVTITINGAQNWNVPVAGNGFRCDNTLGDERNYFTANSTGDTRIWIEAGGGTPGRIISYNDDYRGTGDYNWGVTSRIKKTFSTPVASTLISAYSSSQPSGTCDVYMYCKSGNDIVMQDQYGNNFTICSVFPNLKPDDAINSASQSSVYNCIDWSGGMVDNFYFPPTDYTETWYDVNDLKAFNNFYTKERYPGSMIYTTGGDANNGCVALWYNPNYVWYDYDPSVGYFLKTGGYTHASVRKPGNNQPHGYDWESKPGGLPRTFHPRDALNDMSSNGYGAINLYYTQSTTKSSPGIKCATLKEAVAKGLVSEQIVKMAPEENIKLQGMVGQLKEGVRNNFETKYQAWKKTWSNPEFQKQSNPRMFAQSKEYFDFVEFCKKNGNNILGLVFNKLIEGDYFVRNAIEDLTFSDYRSLIDSVRLERINNNYTKSGLFIAPSAMNGWKNYIKKVLAYYDGKELKKMGVSSDKTCETNVNVTPGMYNETINCNIKDNGKVSLIIYNMNGRKVKVLENRYIKAGYYSYSFSTENLPNGIYICILKTDTQEIKTKIQIVK